MTDATTDPMVQEYERRADEAEHNPMLALLKVARALVWVVYALAIATTVLLATAFFLHLAGANPDAGFVQWVYRSTDSAMRPFRGIFPPHNIGGASVLDFSYLFAAIFYLVVALLVDALHRWLTQRLQQRERDAGEARAQANAAVARAAARQQYASPPPAGQPYGSTPPAGRPVGSPPPAAPPGAGSGR